MTEKNNILRNRIVLNREKKKKIAKALSLIDNSIRRDVKELAGKEIILQSKMNFNSCDIVKFNVICSGELKIGKVKKLFNKTVIFEIKDGKSTEIPWCFSEVENVKVL